MSAKHTPGPWWWEGTPGESNLLFGHIPADGCPAEYSVIRYEPYEGMWFSWLIPDDGRAAANARLIAAAPDLLGALEALEAIFAPLATDSTARDWIDNARAAIAKAKGE